MAAIEKICEYSGEYPSYDMYSYKKNLIQIMPKYRKLFRGKNHALLIFNPTKHFVYGETFQYSPQPEFVSENESYQDYIDYGRSLNTIFKYDKVFYNWKKKFDYNKCKWFATPNQTRIGNLYNYCLYVPSVPGNVNGKYWNYSMNISTVKRKLKRMLGTSKLNVYRLNMTAEEFYDMNEETRNAWFHFYF